MGAKRDEVSVLLHAAHKACFEAPDRDVLGMSYGPFSGVNKTLGIVMVMEDRIAELEALLRRIDAVTAWETTPLGRGFQEEIEAALRR